MSSLGSVNFQRLDEFPSFISCIKCFGRPIIPPLVTPSQKEELKRIQLAATNREAERLRRRDEHLKEKQNTNVSSPSLDYKLGFQISDPESCALQYPSCKNDQEGISVAISKFPTSAIYSSIHTGAIVCSNVIENSGACAARISRESLYGSEANNPHYMQCSHENFNIECSLCQAEHNQSLIGNNFRSEISPEVPCRTYSLLQQNADIMDETLKSNVEESECESLPTIICNEDYMALDTDDSESNQTCMTQSTDLGKYMELSYECSSSDNSAVAFDSKSVSQSTCSRSDEASSETIVNTENELTPCASAMAELTDNIEDELSNADETAGMPDNKEATAGTMKRAHSVDSYMKLLQTCAKNIRVKKSMSEPFNTSQEVSLDVTVVSKTSANCKTGLLIKEDSKESDESRDLPEKDVSFYENREFSKESDKTTELKTEISSPAKKRHIRQNSYTLDQPSSALILAHANCTCNFDTNCISPHCSALREENKPKPAFIKEKVDISVSQEQMKNLPVLSPEHVAGLLKQITLNKEKETSTVIEFVSVVTEDHCAKSNSQPAKETESPVDISKDSENIKQNESDSELCLGKNFISGCTIETRLAVDVVEDSENIKENVSVAGTKDSELASDKILMFDTTKETRSTFARKDSGSSFSELSNSENAKEFELSFDKNSKSDNAKETESTFEQFSSMSNSRNKMENALVDAKDCEESPCKTEKFSNINRLECLNGIFSENLSIFNDAKHREYINCIIQELQDRHNMRVKELREEQERQWLELEKEYKEQEKLLYEKLMLTHISTDLPSKEWEVDQAEINAQYSNEKISENISVFEKEPMSISNSCDRVPCDTSPAPNFTMPVPSGSPHSVCSLSGTFNIPLTETFAISPVSRASISPSNKCMSPDTNWCIPADIVQPRQLFRDSNASIDCGFKTNASQVCSVIESEPSMNGFPFETSNPLPLSMSLSKSPNAVSIPVDGNCDKVLTCFCEKSVQNCGCCVSFNGYSENDIDTSHPEYTSLACKQNLIWYAKEKNTDLVYPPNCSSILSVQNKSVYVNPCDFNDVRKNVPSSTEMSSKDVSTFHNDITSLQNGDQPNVDGKEEKSVSQSVKENRKLSVDNLLSFAKTLRNGTLVDITSKRIITDDPVLMKKFEKLPAFVKGYLTRRLFKTERVQSLIKDLKDISILLQNLNEELKAKGKFKITEREFDFKMQLMSQSMTTYEKFHDIFSISTRERMNIIAESRNFRLKQKHMEQNKKASAHTSSKSPDSAMLKKYKHSSMMLKALGKKRSDIDKRVTSAQCNRYRLDSDSRAASAQDNRNIRSKSVIDMKTYVIDDLPSFIGRSCSSSMSYKTHSASMASIYKTGVGPPIKRKTASAKSSASRGSLHNHKWVP